MKHLVLPSILVLTWGTLVADDLNPVRFKEAPTHAPVVLVEGGQPKASICVMGKPDSAVNEVVNELVNAVEQATGAKLPVVKNKVVLPAIVIGNCDQAAAAGLVGGTMPIEGFAIKTAADCVFIVGHESSDDTPKPAVASSGTAWGTLEFLERFVNVRWYWPPDRGGRSIVKMSDLRLSPVWLEDAPAFRKREIWPPSGSSWNGSGQALGPIFKRLRAGNSWPVNIRVHQPDWSKVAEYTEQRPECFQLGSDGKRNFTMLCYSNPRTLETYLENIARVFDKGEKAPIGISGNTITVSPADAEIACVCPDCQKLWDPNAGRYGTASKIVASFVERLAGEVKKRWPDKTVIYLPYLNYTLAPAGIHFPGNVEVQICGMPGLAQYKEPAIAAEEQLNIDHWSAISGRKIQNWHYDCWPEDRTKAPYQYPHVIQAFYRANRDKTIGTFINGTQDHFPRQNISLYCWMKLLWNPDFNVDDATSEFTRRMFGPAAKTMAELLQIQIDGWEKSRWPDAMMSPKALYHVSYPPDTVKKMKALLARAQQETAGDALSAQRVEYYAAPFDAFVAEYETVVEGKGVRVLTAHKVPENPKIDGKLDDAVWQRAMETSLVKLVAGKEVEPKYATKVKAVWTAEGITYGFHMAEPAPQSLVRNITARDDSNAWWNDNIEIYIDATGKAGGQYYQWIINPNGIILDGRGEDASWNPEGVQAKSFVGEDFWSMEVFIPYSVFPELVRPGTGAEWFGQITRHRMSDAKRTPESIQENQKLNAKFGGYNRNLADFSPLRFLE